MELQWNSSKVIKTQETYNKLISYSKEQQSGYPAIIANLFYEKKNGDMFRVDLNVAGEGCTIMNQEDPWMAVYRVTSKEDFSFLHQIATTQDCDNQQLLNFESVASIMQEYAKFWSFLQHQSILIFMQRFFVTLTLIFRFMSISIRKSLFVRKQRI